MSARSKARRRALEVLFEADVRAADPLQTLRDRMAARSAASEGPFSDYTLTLVQGVAEHVDRIDEILATYAEGWTLDRMPAVDRAVLRIALYEVLWRDDIPDAVAIDEAVELAKALSTDESPRFVNGLLARVILVKPTV